MWARVKGRPGNRITGSSHGRMWSAVACDAIQPRHPSRMPPLRAPPISVLGRPRAERCLRHRELDGHVTPCWVLQSNLRLLYGNHQEISDLRKISDATERRGSALG